MGDSKPQPPPPPENKRLTPTIQRPSKPRVPRSSRGRRAILFQPLTTFLPVFIGRNTRAPFSELSASVRT